MQAEVVHGDAQRAAMLSDFMRSPIHIRSVKVGIGRLLNAHGHIAWFVLVGTAAAAVHWGVVVMLVEHAGWRPLLANVLGWLIAFSVSFSGHHRWTFRSHGAPLWRSALRFFAISAGGFSINEVVYALLLHWSGLRYDLVLGGVLVAVAGGTYLLSRHWAFKRNPAR
jgi:putative flippase GtrA